MRINNLVWMPAILLITSVGLSGSVAQGQPQGQPSVLPQLTPSEVEARQVEARRVEARHAVIDLEKQVSQLKNDTKQRQLIREFYSNLKDSEAKIAAISAIDTRYVHIIPSSMGVELVAPLLKDKDPTVKWYATRAMGWLATIGAQKISSGANLLVALLQDPDKRVREEALSTMGRSGEDKFFTPLKASLADPDVQIHQAAIRAFGSWLSVQQQQLQKWAPPVTDPVTDKGAVAQSTHTK